MVNLVVLGGEADGAVRHVCELQVAHDMMLTARKGLPGHEVYEVYAVHEVYAVQRNAARAKRGESIVEVVQKGRVQRASIRPTDGDARAGASRAGANLSAEGGEKEAEGEVEQTSIV